ncbi:hypothetical protein NRK67_04475 [Fusobacteria bacterium ZRK30]|nr:hypothetical protein NRK67_04475 [Fusobacteria bacterium ZRK30]
MKYNKSHFTIDQQIKKIKSDGFIVNNEDQLKVIWFYLEGTLFFIKYIIDKIKPEYDFNPLYTLIDGFIKKYPGKAIYMGIMTPDKLKYLIETPKI